ncbi:MAG: hypothetical protein ABI970_14865, partial [Chloroflexota bacterium]
MTTLSKPKEQHSNSHLLKPKEYAFVTLYSMDQCVARLNALKENIKNERSHWKWSDLSFVEL